MNQPPKGLVALSSLGSLVLTATAAWLGLHHSVDHHPNSTVAAGFMVAGASLLVAATGLAALIWVLLSFASSSHAWRWTGLVTSVLAICAPWLAPAALIQSMTLSERHDFEKTGPQQLRQAAAELVHSSSNKDYQVQRFGREVPSSEVPQIIRQFIPQAVCVAVDEHGVVVVTDSQRGYRIIPAGSNYIPEQSRRIADGFYSVALVGNG